MTHQLLEERRPASYRGFGFSKHKKTAKGLHPISDPAVAVPVRAALLFVLAVSMAAVAYWSLWASVNGSRDAAAPPVIKPVNLKGTDNTTSSTRTSLRPPPPWDPAKTSLLPPITCPAFQRAANKLKCQTTPQHLHSTTSTDVPPAPTCPDYFRYIHDDLQPWRDTGITRETLERAKRTANFRLIIIGGRAYVERYRRSFQSRDVFTIWGILQLLRRYPGRVPDLELMFDCVDWPVVMAKNYRVRRGRPPPPVPPPLFRYCGDDATMDVVFPDWSFWGWPEINIKPWGKLLEELKEGNNRSRWIDREPYAYWKGNPRVAQTRMDLLKCNVSDQHDWNARVFAQDWAGETQRGFKESDLASQCNYRYKIYIEGSAWSVSDKYILACDSLALVVTPKYYDFFSRALVPVHHYWPINTTDKCSSIKFAVDWGNSHKRRAQEIGKEATRFIHDDLTMDYVYDYMLHLLTEYAKLQRFKPTLSPGAVEACTENMACRSRGLEREFMAESMVNASRDSGPCTLPPPFSPQERKAMDRGKGNALQQVELWRRNGSR